MIKSKQMQGSHFETQTSCDGTYDSSTLPTLSLTNTIGSRFNVTVLDEDTDIFGDSCEERWVDVSLQLRVKQWRHGTSIKDGGNKKEKDFI